MEREKVMSKRQAAAAENLFEFIPVTSKNVMILEQGEAPPKVPSPEWIVSRFQRPKTMPSSALQGRLGLPHEKAKRVAVIVPFRDLHAAQERQKHLDQFVPYFVSFLPKFTEDYRVFIIEQSNDRRKFNRGQLLNIGFLLARQQGCDAFIFHDVDLLPSDDLGPWYGVKPSTPVHIARVWDRYAEQSADYFGGIAAWSAEDFDRINGFPNNYWGWGGEDDEMMRRCKTVFGDRFAMDAPLTGSMTDLEDMSLDEKISFLRDHPEWKCNVRWELRAEHVDTWASNGLRTLQQDPETGIEDQYLPFTDFQVLSESPIGPEHKVVKYTVVLAVHGDWTDAYAPERDPPQAQQQEPTMSAA